MRMNGKIISLNISEKKGTQKKPVINVNLVENYGIDGDAHASSDWHRQVSLLAIESIKKMQDLGLDVDCGDFAENITTEGIDLVSLPLGTKMSIGNGAEVEVTQIGKECKNHCTIFDSVGFCVMPDEGIFVRVLKGGELAKGDPVDIIAQTK